ncbi:MAG: SLBB domain-containing protein [Gemmatimonadota bacterium]
MKIRTMVLGLLVTIPVASLRPAPLAAQDTQEAIRRAEQLLGRSLAPQDVLRLLQQSGLSPDEIRARLQREGLSPSAAEPYLAVLEGRADEVPEGTSPLALMQVLSGMRLTELERPDTSAIGLLEPPERALAADTAGLELEPPGPPIFGRDVFARATSQFTAPLTGPVPSNYRLGPGDEIVLVLTGDVELAYRLTVSREGWIVIPDVGRVTVNGLDLGGLRRSLHERLARVYSGLTGQADATTFLDVSLGALRTNQVFVIGEVEQPGAYQLSSLASALTALYWAGGPNRAGSFREISVNRGEERVARVDLYDYLLHGRADRDVRLEDGDVVFVPPVRRRVEIDGAVVRPGIYELAEGETLADLIRFAGGTLAEASVERAQVERTLPPDERRPGMERVILDLPLGDPDAPDVESAPLLNGDRVTLFAVLEELRNEVRISGGVWRPGVYGAEPGLRLWDLIERAGGLLPDVYAGRVQIQRLRPDYTRRMIAASLARTASGAPAENPEIRPQDQVYVFARRNLREERVVSIGGWVRAPGVYPFVDGMTVRDLVLRAGGLRTGAYLGRVDVARVVISQTRGDTITQNLAVALDSSLVFDRPTEEGAAGPTGAARGGGGFVLRNLDAVYVRKAPGFESQRRVMVTGEVMFPGPYSLQTRGERLMDLLARAGGLTPQAYAQGLQLWRAETEVTTDTLSAAEIAGQAFGDTALAGMQAVDTTAFPAARPRVQPQAPGADGTLPAEAGGAPGAGAVTEAPAGPVRLRVGMDFERALRDPSSPHNILIEPNDSIYVPTFIPTVDVRGAVGAPTKVLYRRGAGVGYYINRAGGYSQEADKGRTRVELANGEIATRGGKFLFFGGGMPDPDPGSVITVPRKIPKEGGVNFAQLATILASFATATATIIIAAKR